MSRHCYPWSADDDQWLYALWVHSNHKAQVVAAILGRSPASVGIRASGKGWRHGHCSKSGQLRPDVTSVRPLKI